MYPRLKEILNNCKGPHTVSAANVGLSDPMHCVFKAWYWRFAYKLIRLNRGHFAGSCVFCAPLDRYIGRHLGRHFDRHSTDVSVDIAAECRSTYRSSVSRHIDRCLTEMSADISSDTSRSTYRPMYQPRYRPSDSRYIDRLSADISADTLTIDCRRNIGRPSVVYRPKA